MFIELWIIHIVRIITFTVGLALGILLAVIFHNELRSSSARSLRGQLTEASVVDYEGSSITTHADVDSSSRENYTELNELYDMSVDNFMSFLDTSDFSSELEDLYIERYCHNNPELVKELILALDSNPSLNKEYLGKIIYKFAKLFPDESRELIEGTLASEQSKKILLSGISRNDLALSISIIDSYFGGEEEYQNMAAYAAAVHNPAELQRLISEDKLTCSKSTLGRLYISFLTEDPRSFISLIEAGKKIDLNALSAVDLSLRGASELGSALNNLRSVLGVNTLEMMYWLEQNGKGSLGANIVSNLAMSAYREGGIKSPTDLTQLIDFTTGNPTAAKAMAQEMATLSSESILEISAIAIQSKDDSGEVDEFKRSLLNEWARHSPQDSIRVALAQLEESGNYDVARIVIPKAIGFIARTDAEAAWEQYSSEIPSALQAETEEDVLLSLAAVDPRFVTSISDNSNIKNLPLAVERRIANVWSFKSPEQAVAWVESATDDKVRGELTQIVMRNWLESNIYDASQYINTMDNGYIRDRAVAQLVAHLQSASFADASQWAQSITDRNLRLKVMSELKFQ